MLATFLKKEKKKNCDSIETVFCLSKVSVLNLSQQRKCFLMRNNIYVSLTYCITNNALKKRIFSGRTKQYVEVNLFDSNRTYTVFLLLLIFRCKRLWFQRIRCIYCIALITRFIYSMLTLRLKLEREKFKYWLF